MPIPPTWCSISPPYLPEATFKRGYVSLQVRAPSLRANPRKVETMMTKNMSGVDVTIRAVVGSLLMAWAAVVADSRPFLTLGGALLATVILATSIAGICPLYTILGLDTRARSRPQAQPQPRVDAQREPAHQLR
jgi:Protein of unknown function (DUF2892)